MKTILLTVFASLVPIALLQAELPQVQKVDVQPLLVQVKHLQEALDYLGEPLPSSGAQNLKTASKTKGAAKVTRIVQEALDPFTLAVVTINPESRVKVSPGSAKPELAEHGWRNFLVKVVNEAGVTAPLRSSSPSALPASFGGWG